MPLGLWPWRSGRLEIGREHFSRVWLYYMFWWEQNVCILNIYNVDYNVCKGKYIFITDLGKCKVSYLNYTFELLQLKSLLQQNPSGNQTTKKGEKVVYTFLFVIGFSCWFGSIFLIIRGGRRRVRSRSTTSCVCTTGWMVTEVSCASGDLVTW